MISAIIDSSHFTLKLLSNSGLFIAIGAASYTAYYSKILHIPIDPFRTTLIFFATIASYSGVQIIPLLIKPGHNLLANSTQHLRQQWFIANKKLILMMITFSLAIVVSLSFFISFNDLLIFSHLFVLVLFYEKIGHFKFKELKFIKELRGVPYLKSLLISYVWAASCSMPQIVEILFKRPLGVTDYLVGIESFCFILALTIPFDIRDFEYDQKLKLKTLVHLMGIKKTKVICMLLMLLSLSITLNSHTTFYPVVGLILVIYSYILLKAKSSLHDYYFFFGLDSLIILKLLSVL